MKLGIIIWIAGTCSLIAQVGINTSSPQQALHLAGSTGTLRIESLNSVNSNYNGGDVNGDSVLSNDTFPLYVDQNGDFTLELNTLFSSEELDALDNTTLPNSSVYLDPTNVNGISGTTITSYNITVNRATLLEIRYSISFDVYKDMTNNPITDNLARRIVNLIAVSGTTRLYGRSSKCFTNTSTLGVPGTMYNSATTYVSLPSAGTYTISLRGSVGSNIKGGGGGSVSKETYVEFATGNDFLFIRMH